VERVRETKTKTRSSSSSILGFYQKLKSSFTMVTKVRKPSHAGSWYTDNRKFLQSIIDFYSFNEFLVKFF